MPDAWKSYSSAPTDGSLVCRADEIAVGTVKCLRLTTDNGEFPVLLAGLADGLRVYVNACPHQYLPLDYRGDKLLSADGRMIRCTNHDAAFCVATGKGLEGLGVGGQLDAVPVRIEHGNIVIDDK